VRELVRTGRLVATFDRVQKREVIFHRDAVAHARRTIEGQLAGAAGFLVGELGRALGISRKHSIPLLEHLDSVHFTRRVGDRRVLARGAPGRPRSDAVNPVGQPPLPPAASCREES
jgi:selenocysteine-specific elongation factor